jgi:regulator of replication initiation timing
VRYEKMDERAVWIKFNELEMKIEKAEDALEEVKKCANIIAEQAINQEKLLHKWSFEAENLKKRLKDLDSRPGCAKII